MATIKSHTDLKQSKELAKILPITSIDFAWNIFSDGSTRLLHIDDWGVFENAKSNVEIIPCWSLAALLSVLPSSSTDSSDDNHFRIYCKGRFTEWHENPVDACVEMITRLNERKCCDYYTEKK